MSRIGKKNIAIPAGVTVSQEHNIVTVKGPKGELKQDISPKIEVTIAEAEVALKPVEDDKNLFAKWGLYRVLIANMITGVSEGFTKKLIVDGIGYKAELKGTTLMISAGFSHPFLYMPPEGITFQLEGPTKVSVCGIDKQKVGQVAAEIRKIRPPEPYKGKGIRYDGEVIIRKAGKTGGKK